MSFAIIQGDCTVQLRRLKSIKFFSSCDLTFLDPPFNQNKEYQRHNDNLPETEYWNWMQEITTKVYDLTNPGGAIYFMQREKNAEKLLRCLRLSGWYLQNLIIWQKKTSAVPSQIRYGKHYQIIAFATKGKRPRVFNRLRVDPPVPAGYKPRENGLYVTDCWNDIRELTSGYYAGDEAFRTTNGERFHKQQSPVALLLRIVLSSSKPCDLVLDPFAGTGTMLAVAQQLQRNSVGIEIDEKNIETIRERLRCIRAADNISRFFSYYRYTKNLNPIWPDYEADISEQQQHAQAELFHFPRSRKD